MGRYLAAWVIECSTEIYESDCDVVGIFGFDGRVCGGKLVVFVGPE